MENPYAAPLNSPTAPPAVGGISPRILQALAGTKPWVRLCSVMGFIGSGFIFLAAAGMLVGGVLGMGATGDAMGGGAFMGLAIVYALMGVLYLFPSIKLWSYGTHIFRMLNSRSMSDLEAALEAQRSFWKFVGIMVVIMLALYVVMIFFGLFAGFAAAA